MVVFGGATRHVWTMIRATSLTVVVFGGAARDVEAIRTVRRSTQLDDVRAVGVDRLDLSQLPEVRRRLDLARITDIEQVPIYR